MSGEEAARQFGSLAQDYARSRSHREGATLTLLLERAMPRPQDRVADVGTGAGHTAVALAPRVARVVAVDVTEGMLRETRRAARVAGLHSLQVVRAAAEALPFADGSLDLAVSRTAAHHFDDLPGALREMRRVLRPGGRVVVADLAASPDEGLRQLQHRLEVLHDPTHRRTWTPDEWRAELAAAGFVDVDVEGGVEARLRELHEGTLVAEWCARSRTTREAEKEIGKLLAEAKEEQRQALAVSGEGVTLRFHLYKLVARGRTPPPSGAKHGAT